MNDISNWLKRGLGQIKQAKSQAQAQAPIELSASSEKIFAQVSFSAEEINRAWAQARVDLGLSGGQAQTQELAAVELTPTSKRILANASFSAEEINRAYAQARKEQEQEQGL